MSDLHGLITSLRIQTPSDSGGNGGNSGNNTLTAAEIRHFLSFAAVPTKPILGGNSGNKTACGGHRVPTVPTDHRNGGNILSVAETAENSQFLGSVPTVPTVPTTNSDVGGDGRHFPVPQPATPEQHAVTGLMLASHAHKCSTCGAWACFGFGPPGKAPTGWFCTLHRTDGECLRQRQ